MAIFFFYFQYLEFSLGQYQRSSSTSQVLQLGDSKVPPFTAREGMVDSYRMEFKGKPTPPPHPQGILCWSGQDPKRKGSGWETHTHTHTHIRCCQGEEYSEMHTRVPGYSFANEHITTRGGSMSSLHPSGLNEKYKYWKE